MANRRHTLAVLFLAALLTASASWAGQTVGTATGSIEGTAKDATGAVLPGVGITIFSDALIGPRQPTTTDPGGKYQIHALPPGNYTLSFSLPGFVLERREVRVSVGRTATVDVPLTITAQTAEVTVTTRTAALDRHSAAIAETFDSRQLADLPIPRSAGGLIAATQGMYVTNVEVGGGTGILSGTHSAYGRSSSPRHTLEGIVVTGLFGFGFTLDYGSLEEASVLTAAHSADWPTMGLHTQFVTKSGGNQYRGKLYADYEHRRWQWFNVDGDQILRVAPSGGGLSPQDVNRLWNYHDVNADVGGFILKDRLWWYSSIRQQEVSSRRVNFPVEPYSTHLANVGGKATYRIANGNTLVAYGQRQRNHQPFALDPFGRGGGGLSAATAINESVDSTANQRNANWVWKGEWNSIIDDALLFEVRLGQFGTEQDSKARSALPRFEDIETLLVSGGNRDTQFSARRNQLFGTLSYFKDGWAGSHHLKFGGEAIRFFARDSWLSAYPGNVLHVLSSGEPDSVFLFATPTQSENGVWTYSAYAMDSWRLKSRLTLNLGVQFERYRLFLPAQEHPAGSPDAQQFAPVDNLIDWNTVAPRIAAVYDLTGEGKTLAKVTFARYRAAPNIAVAASANPNTSEWWTQYEWADADGSGVWEPGEQGTRQGGRGGRAVESRDPALELPVLNEASLWIERELPAGIGLRTGAIWRHEHSQFARQNASQPFDAFTVPVAIRDPGPDGTSGTSDDGPTLVAYDLRPDYINVQSPNILRNVPGSTSEYWTWEIAATRHAPGRWWLGAGFTHTWSRDQASGYLDQTVRTNVYPLTPNDLINAGAGGRHEFTTWTAKAHGSYEAPWGVRVSPVLRHQSGQPFGRTFTTDRSQLQYRTVTVLAEPIGTRRTDNVTLVDVRLEKEVRLNETRRLSAFLDVFNCFNANPEVNTIWSSGPSFLQPLSIVSPRIARVGLTFDW